MVNDPYSIKSSERGAVRVFATELEPDADAAITAHNVQKLLGDGVTLVASKVEVFPSRVIEDMGLSAYLSEGYGIPKEDLDGKAAALDALKGLVILIPSSAFGGAAQVLEPRPALRFLGLFQEPVTTHPTKMVDTDAAKGGLSAPQASVQEDKNSVHNSWIIAVGALIIAAALVLFAVF